LVKEDQEDDVVPETSETMHCERKVRLNFSRRMRGGWR
jgi:hypothetical protein